MTAPSHHQAEPRVLADRFELRHVLGVGGMATVWSAWDRRLDRTVAVKVLRDDVSEDHAERIRREARAAARIDDPRVVTVLDLEHDGDGRPFLVLEALGGRTLSDDLRDGPLSPERAERLAADLLGALGAAHDVGVLHRDVKPSNLLRDGDGYRVTDFGIASLDDEGATSGDLMGTLVYLAPERFEGAPATPRSDVFSAAAVIYEALTGRQPFRGDTAAESLHRLRSGIFEPLPDDVPAGLAAAVTAGLDPDPARRPADASAFARLVAQGAPAPAHRTEPIEVGDVTERIDRSTAVLPATASPEPSAEADHTVRIDRSARPGTSVFDLGEPSDLDVPSPREPARSEALADMARRPQVVFIVIGVVLLLAVLGAAAIGGGGTTAARPAAEPAEPAERLDQQLERIEELGR